MSFIFLVFRRYSDSQIGYTFFYFRLYHDVSIFLKGNCSFIYQFLIDSCVYMSVSCPIPLSFSKKPLLSKEYFRFVFHLYHVSSSSIFFLNSFKQSCSAFLSAFFLMAILKISLIFFHYLLIAYFVKVEKVLIYFLSKHQLFNT